MPPGPQAYEAIIENLKVIFSWIVLLPCSVIISGLLLSSVIKLETTDKCLFRIDLKLLQLEARGSEVVLGLASFLICFTVIGCSAGPLCYELVKVNFGIDPGKFSSLCFFSGLVNLSLVIIFCTFTWLSKQAPGSSFISNPEQYKETIERLTHTEGIETARELESPPSS